MKRVPPRGAVSMPSALAFAALLLIVGGIYRLQREGV